MVEEEVYLSADLAGFPLNATEKKVAVDVLI